MKKLLSFLLAIVLLANLSVALTSCGDDEINIDELLTDDIINQMKPTIEISDDGYWVINGIKTETKAIATDGANGTDGVTPTIDISSDGYWVINGTKTEHKAIGTDGAPGATGAAGATPTIEISSDGYWVINGTKTEHKAIGTDGAPGATGAAGAAGATPTIEISSDGYWVINGTKTEYKAVGTDGAPGEPGAPGAPGTPGTSTTPTAKNVTITFNADNGTALTTQTVAAGSKVTKPADPTKEGYAFGGWYVDDEKWSFIGYCATEDLTLTAKWNELYTVEFYSMDELLSPTFSFEYGTYLNPPEIPEVEGYDLVCWYTVNDRGWEYEWDFKRDFVCEDTKLYADWVVKTYDIYFVVNGEIIFQSWAEHGDKTYNYHYQISSIWTLPDGTVWDFDNDVVTSDIYLTAQFPANYTYNTTTSVMPRNWNELTYADGNEAQIMDYIGSSLFSYDYKFENDQKFLPDGSLNRDGIVDGAFTVNYDAATKLEDVTSFVDAKWGYTPDQKAEGGYAWQITLRTDLKWDDGTPINAHDFVYSMQAQLDPDFMNFRANTYYNGLKIKNSRSYFIQNLEGTYETVDSLGYTTIQEAIDAGVTLYVDTYATWGGSYYVDEAGNPAPQWVAIDDETIYYYEGIVSDDFFSGAMIWDTLIAYGYGPYIEPGASEYSVWVTCFVENPIRYVAWEDVGMYAVDDYSFVICLDKAYNFLNEDGSLSVWAAYDMPSLPLVHKGLYESCKQPPAYGSTLWTTTYNTSLETTASWGPYKLVEFYDNGYYRLVKNENWYGYSMETNKGQYNVTAINCRKVEEATTQWMGFLAGEYDNSSLDTHNVDEYLDSKYVHFSEGATGTYGMQLFSNLTVLKNSNNNNGILAIADFRQAFNLALNRSHVVETIWPGTATPCFGLFNSAYYYDIENAPNLADGGKYRNSTIAKEGILRAYGYTQGTDGKWSINNLTGLSTDEAYSTLTGYNLTLAKEKMRAAIAELEGNAEFYGYDSSKKITLVYGSSADTDKQRFRANYLQGVLDQLVAGTSLEGKIEVKFDASAGSKWADAFRSGATQIGFGYGFQGNALNPFDIIGAFVNPNDSLNYHMYWDTSAIDLTLTMPAGNYAGAGQTITMSVQNWYFCLNGIAAENDAPIVYNWSADYAPVEARLMILSALEEITIKESRSIMLIADSGGSFLSAQFSYFSDDYNTFMGYGGIRYMIGEYSDGEWESFLAKNNWDLSYEYRKTN